MPANIKDIINIYLPQIQRVFVFYCSFADKDNYALLKIQNYQRLIADLQLGDYQHLIPQFDVIFYRHAQTSSLDIFKFIKVLQDISALVFQEIAQEKKLQKLLKVHLKTLAQLILTDTDFGQSLSVVSDVFVKESSLMFLGKFEQTLFLFYSTYFRRQGRGGLEQQLKMLFKLCREMNLLPRVVVKPLVYLIFRYLREKTARSVFMDLIRVDVSGFKMYKFDFMCFLEYLVILAHTNSRGYEPEHRKIYKLLELMEVSSGCRQLSKQYRFKHLYLSEEQLSQEGSLFQSPKQIIKKQSETLYQTKMVSVSPLKRKLGGLYNSLRQKFIKLCARRWVQTNFYLSFSVGKKLLSKICPSLNSMTIQLMLNGAGRLNFQNFVNLIDAVALKVQVKSEMLYQLVIAYETENYHLGAIIQNVRLSVKDDCYFQEIIQFVQPYLRSIYQYYEFKGGLILSSYLKLLQETAVIPKILSIAQAMDVYRFSVQVEDCMTFVQFLKSLKAMMVSVHFDYELQGMERLIFVLERMCQSKRGEMLMKKNVLMMKQNPLYKLRLNYQSFYKSIQDKLNRFNQGSSLSKCRTVE